MTIINTICTVNTAAKERIGVATPAIKCRNLLRPPLSNFVYDATLRRFLYKFIKTIKSANGFFGSNFCDKLKL